MTSHYSGSQHKFFLAKKKLKEQQKSDINVTESLMVRLVIEESIIDEIINSEINDVNYDKDILSNEQHHKSDRQNSVRKFVALFENNDQDNSKNSHNHLNTRNTLSFAYHNGIINNDMKFE